MITKILMGFALGISAMGALCSIILAIDAYEADITGWVWVAALLFLMNMWWICDILEKVVD